MTIGTKVDQAVELSQSHPVYSIASGTIGGLSLLSNSPLTIAAGFVSPLVTAINSAIGAVGLARKDRGLLSKAFSGASVASGIAAGLVFVDTMDAPGFAPIAGYIATSASMLATSAFNTAAYYTRNVGRNIGIEFKVTHKKEDEPLFRSVRSKPAEQETTAPAPIEPS